MNNENRCPKCVLNNNNKDCTDEFCSNFVATVLSPEINVYNTLFLIERNLLKNGLVKQTTFEVIEILRPFLIALDRHKELAVKESFNNGFNSAKALFLSKEEFNKDFAISDATSKLQ